MLVRVLNLKKIKFSNSESPLLAISEAAPVVNLDDVENLG